MILERKSCFATTMYPSPETIRAQKLSEPRNGRDLNSGKDGANPKNNGNESREFRSSGNHRLVPLARGPLHDDGKNQRQKNHRHLHAKDGVGIIVTAVGRKHEKS